MALNIRKAEEPKADKPRKLPRRYADFSKTPAMDPETKAMIDRLGFTDAESVRVIHEYAWQHRTLAARMADPRHPNAPTDPDNPTCYGQKRYQVIDWMNLLGEDGERVFEAVAAAVDKTFKLKLMPKRKD